MGTEGIDPVAPQGKLPPSPFVGRRRSEEHTSELQSLMRISYAVLCLKKKNKPERQPTQNTIYAINHKQQQQNHPDKPHRIHITRLLNLNKPTTLHQASSTSDYLNK